MTRVTQFTKTPPKYAFTFYLLQALRKVSIIFGLKQIIESVGQSGNIVIFVEHIHSFVLTLECSQSRKKVFQLCEYCFAEKSLYFYLIDVVSTCSSISDSIYIFSKVTFITFGVQLIIVQRLLDDWDLKSHFTAESSP